MPQADPAARDLLAAAHAARAHAYAPYSRFRVGAAVRTRAGKVYPGCNVESASYGLTVCAERVALQSAVAAGERDFVAVAVVAGEGAKHGGESAAPCGACRQVLWEFGDMDVVMPGPDADTPRVLRLSELLPRAFGPPELTAGQDAP